MKYSWLVLTICLAAGSVSTLPASSAVLFSETGTPDMVWRDDGDPNDWMIGFTEQDVINAGWSGTEAEQAWLLDPWHNPYNRVLAVGLLGTSPDKADTSDALISSAWPDMEGRADVPWTVFCNVALFHDIEPGFTETVRLDLKAQGEIVDSVSVAMSGIGFSTWIFMAGSIHEPTAETGMNHCGIHVSVGHLSHANSISAMVDDIGVYESQYIEDIIGRPPNPGLTAAVQSIAELDPLPLPILSTNAGGDMILTWRTTEGYTYDVQRSAARSYGGAGWSKIAEGVSHHPSGTVIFSDDGAGESFAGAYYRVLVHPPGP